MDTGLRARKPAQRHAFLASREAFPAGGGRSVDVEAKTGRYTSKRKRLISRNFLKPSDGLEPSTPSLPSSAGIFFLEIDPSSRVGRARACPRVPDLMYPSRTRGVLSVYKTDNSYPT